MSRRALSVRETATPVLSRTCPADYGTATAALTLTLATGALLGDTPIGPTRAVAVRQMATPMLVILRDRGRDE